MGERRDRLREVARLVLQDEREFSSAVVNVYGTRLYPFTVFAEDIEELTRNWKED